MIKMRKQQMRISRLTCGACGTASPIARKASSTRDLGHVKHMHCAKCEATKPFIEHVADTVEGLWIKEATHNSYELNQVTTLYNPTREEVLNKKDKVEVLKEVESELGEGWTPDKACESLEDRGYVIHIMNAYFKA